MPKERDWQKYNAAKLAELDPVMRNRAVRFLKDLFKPEVVSQIKEAIEEEPNEWWIGRHFGWGMGVRNALRNNGFSEQDLGVGNLDDYYIPLVEQAVMGGAENEIIT